MKGGISYERGGVNYHIVLVRRWGKVGRVFHPYHIKLNLLNKFMPSLLLISYFQMF